MEKKFRVLVNGSVIEHCDTLDGARAVEVIYWHLDTEIQECKDGKWVTWGTIE